MTLSRSDMSSLPRWRGRVRERVLASGLSDFGQEPRNQRSIHFAPGVPKHDYRPVLIFVQARTRGRCSALLGKVSSINFAATAGGG